MILLNITIPLLPTTTTKLCLQGGIFENSFEKFASTPEPEIPEGENKQTRFNVKSKSLGPIDCKMLWSR